VGTVIQDKLQSNPERQPRWDRCERADLCAPSLEWPAHGGAQRQAAQELQVPRTPLQAWRRGHDTLDSGPPGAEFLPSGPGLAFLPRLVMAFPLGCVAVGACGMRLVCLWLTLTGLDRFGAASSGAQPQVTRRGEEAMGAYRQDATARLAKARPRKDLTGPQDATFPGGRCRMTMAPDSHCIIVEPLAQAREPGLWNALLAPARAQLPCQGMPSTSEAAPGLRAYGAHYREAPHAPALGHVQPERSQAVSAPMAPKERAAHKVGGEAREPLEQAHAPPQSAGDAPDKRGPSRPPKAPVSLEQAAQGLAAARRAHARRTLPREPVPQSLRGIRHAYQVVALERAGRRNGPLMASESHAHSEPVRAIAQPEGLSQSGLERLEKAARVVPTMPATLACVSGYVRQQVAPLALPQPPSCAMHAKRRPSSYLDRVAQTRTGRAGEPLRERAERLRAPVVEPGGAGSALSPAARDQLHDEAQRLAAVCQRSRATVEGRNGSLSLRHHQLRGLDLPRKRECCTAMHNLCRTRPDGTTAAERFVGQKPRSMLAAIGASVELPPAPLSPPRRA
jgi:hypothetical protein